MFQPQSTPFATSFYGVAGAASAPGSSSQPSYGLLPLGFSPDGGAGGDDQLPVVVSGYGFTPSPSSAGHGSGLGIAEVGARAPPVVRGTTSTVNNSHGGAANGSALNNNTLTSGSRSMSMAMAMGSSDAGGKRPLDQTDFKFDGAAARLSSKESHHGRATAAQLHVRQEQQQRQEQQGQQHLLYASPSPISLAHRIPRRTQQQQQQQQQELEPPGPQQHLMMLLRQAAAAPATGMPPGHARQVPPSSLAHSHSRARAHHPRTHAAAPSASATVSAHTTAVIAGGSTHAGNTHAQAQAHANAHSRSGSHHPAATSPNHQPSPPSRTRSHLTHTHTTNPPLSHFVQPGSSSCNQQASLNYTHQHHHKATAAAANQTFNIPSPAGSASSSSPSASASSNPNVVQAAGDPSSTHPYTSGGHSSIVTPAASTPSNRTLTADMTGDAASEPISQDDLVAQQRAAETYQPQLEGPVIGERVSSDVITEEYAKADQFYVEKTINLPQTYSHFRPVQGDGNCGWRAIGFSYFEQLILSGDPEKLQLEVARMTSLNNYLSTYGGYDLELFEDMVFETINLLKDLAACAPDTNAAMTLLMQRFNDRECSNAIVYHLRLLAGSWLKGNFTQYEPFLDTGGDVASWAHLNIEVPDKEIDHLSIMLLTSILLKPIGVVLEIAYLDRTPGSEVNTYRFPDETNGQDPMNLGPIIYLLFRPDHYDILYKSLRESIMPMPTPQPVALNLQVNRAASFSHHHQITSHPPSLHSFATLDYSPLAMLPGFGGPPSGLTSMTTSSPASPMHNAFASPAQSWMQSPFSDTSMQQNIPPPPPPPQPQALAAGPTQAPSPSQPQLPVAGAPAKPNQPVDYQLRFSSQCFHLKNPTADSSLLPQVGAFPEPSFTTTMFKNSHFNKAHYNNPHFHPEEWAPDDEAHERVASGVVKKKSKTKSEQ